MELGSALAHYPTLVGGYPLKSEHVGICGVGVGSGSVLDRGIKRMGETLRTLPVGSYSSLGASSCIFMIVDYQSVSNSNYE